MELLIGNRYQLTYAIQTLLDGVLYAGKELSLQRDVIIYIFNKEKDGNTEDLQRIIGQVSHLNNTSFCHVLNAGVIDGHVYVVFTAYSGKPLIQSIQHQSFTSREILSKIYELGLSMHTAMEDNLYGYSVTGENLWLTNDNQLKIINYWTQAETEQTSSMGLCLLMYQLHSQSCVIPKTLESVQYQLLRSFEDLTAKQQEALAALIRRVFRGDNSLLTFILGLRDILEVPDSIKPLVTPITREQVTRHEQVFPRNEQVTRHEQVPTRNEQVTKHEQVPKRYEQATRANEQSTRQREPQSKYDAYKNKNLAEDVQYDGYDEDDSYEETSNRSWGNKLKLIAGIMIAGIVFIGILFLTFTLLTSSNPNKNENLVTKVESTSNPSSNDKSTPVPTEPNATETSKPTTKPTTEPSDGTQSEEVPKDDSVGDTAESDQEIIATPNLIGLTEKEAKRIALENKLHFNFTKENSDQPSGTIINQEPAAGTPIAKGGTVNFTISRNKE